MNHSFADSRRQPSWATLLILIALISLPAFGQKAPARESAEGHYQNGLALLQKQQVDLAITEFRASIRVNPKVAETHASLGFALGAKGLLPEAIAEFETAVKLKPDFACLLYTSPSPRDS